MRIVFMGTPQFAVPTLDALKAAGHDIAAVCTQPDRPAGRSGRPRASAVKCRALEHSCCVHQPEHFRSAEIERTLRDLAPELLVVVAYGLKLPRRILDIPRCGAINLHPSLLPKYRGAAPVNWAIINGDTATGISTIFMSEEMDAGDVILEERVAILPDETAGELKQRLSQLGAGLVTRTVGLIAAGNAPRKPQNESLATAAPKLKSIDATINWACGSRMISNLVRGMTPKPGAHTLFRGQRLEIARVETFSEYRTTNGESRIGQIVGLEKSKGPVVGTGDGAVVITAVKPAGKKSMSGLGFLNGYHLSVGERLG